MGARSFYVYILASRIGGTLYIGVTNDLIRRVGEHRLKLVDGFTKKYEVARLVYFEQFDDPAYVPFFVMPRACGASSTPRPKRLTRNATEYWIVRLRGR
jgi:hypothetical protein